MIGRIALRLRRLMAGLATKQNERFAKSDLGQAECMQKARVGHGWLMSLNVLRV